MYKDILVEHTDNPKEQFKKQPYADLFLCVHMFVFVLVCTCEIAHVWRAENSMQKLGFSFHHVDPEDGTQVVKLGPTC